MQLLTSSPERPGGPIGPSSPWNQIILTSAGKLIKSRSKAAAKWSLVLRSPSRVRYNRFCCRSRLTSLPLSQAALVAQVNLSPLVFPGWAQTSGQIKADAEMSSDEMRMVFVHAGEGSQHQPKARKQDISAARALPAPSANYFPIHLHPNSIHTEPALNQCHSFCQFCPEENYPSCMTVDSCNKKKKVCHLPAASVTFGPSWPFSPGEPMSPGKPCSDQFKIKAFSHAHWSHMLIAAVSMQTSGPGGPGEPSGPFSPILPCNRDQQECLKDPRSLWNEL